MSQCPTGSMVKLEVGASFGVLSRGIPNVPNIFSVKWQGVRKCYSLSQLKQ